MKGILTVLSALAIALLPFPARAATERIKVSDNGRYLVYENGSPFFYLGDTAWELFHRLNREEAVRYLEDRARKQFTVIQAVVLGELDGLNVGNAYGEKPLVEHDPSRPNEEYFKHVDYIVKEANRRHLMIGMLPTWGDKWNLKWGKGPVIFDQRNAEAYGEWLGRRYKDAGIIWILGGDRPVENEEQKGIVRAMARGLEKGDGGVHLKTFHPTGGSSSSRDFHDDPWLDFNMRQNGHGAEFTGGYDQTFSDYRRTPVKPVLDGEPIYEDHPVSFQADKQGHSIAADVRRPLYWDLFTGACGHTYGHHSVWQMFDPAKTAPVNAPLMPWTEALDQPGAGQMQYGRRLMESRPYLSRVPDASIVVTDPVPTAMPGAGTRKFVATRDSDGTYAMVYAPVGRPFTVRMDVIRGRKVKAWWFNPRDGKATLAGVLPNKGGHRFHPPAAGEFLDWVLVLDDASLKYPPPGSVPLKQAGR